MPEPIAPVAPATPDPATPAAPVDPILKSLADSMGVAVADLMKPDDAEAAAAPVLPSALRTLGDFFEKPEGTQGTQGTEGTATPATPAVPVTPVAAAIAAPEPVKVEKPQADALKAELAKLQATQPEPPAPTTPTPADPDAEYVKTLTEEQVEELEFAKFADEHGMPGQSKKVLEYFKATDTFAKENPDSDAESEEFKQFVETNRPAYKNRRKLEQEQIADKAVSSVRSTMAEETKKHERRMREIELKPVIERALTAFETLLVSPDAPRPSGVDVIDSDVSATMKREGVEAAARKYPDEVPVLDFTARAAEAYLKIVNGVAPLDLNDPTHKWLDFFIRKQEENMLARPEAERKLRGKTFSSYTDLARIAQERPQDLARYDTFSNEDILNMMATNAATEVSSRIKSREAAGWVRAKPAKAPGSQTTAAPVRPAEPTSPKGGATSVPGPALTGPMAALPSPHVTFLEAIMPGSTKQKAA